jgi:hypothetical protein
MCRPSRMGKPLELLELAARGEITLSVSEPIIEEAAGVLRDKFQWAREAVREVDANHSQHCRGGEAFLGVDVKNDPRDNRILECALDRVPRGSVEGRYKHRLLLMLDEFPSLGRLDILQESLAFVAGYGIKCSLICQDINQLKSHQTSYGPEETITSNCHVQSAYPPNRVETAEHLSKLSG